MALVHSRIRRVFFAVSRPDYGALGGRWAVHQEKSLNHHYEVCPSPLSAWGLGGVFLSQSLLILTPIASDHTSRRCLDHRRAVGRFSTLDCRGFPESSCGVASLILGSPFFLSLLGIQGSHEKPVFEGNGGPRPVTAMSTCDALPASRAMAGKVSPYFTYLPYNTTYYKSRSQQQMMSLDSHVHGEFECSNL